MSIATPNVTLKKQANELLNEFFDSIRQVLESEGARILQERVFSTGDAFQITHTVRAECNYPGIKTSGSILHTLAKWSRYYNEHRLFACLPQVKDLRRHINIIL